MTVGISNGYKICPDNLVEDWGAMQDWTAGTSVAPTGWTALGTPGSIAQETVNIMAGTYSMKVIGGASGSYGAQIAVQQSNPAYSGLTMTFGTWVMCSSANAARLSINDGVTTTFSSYHTGDGTWQFLSVTVQINPNNTLLNIACNVTGNGTVAYFANAVLVRGPNVFTYLQALSSFVYARPENVKVSIPGNVQQFELARKEGQGVAQTKMSSKSIKLSVQLVGDTLAAVRPNYDSMVSNLLTDGLKDLYFSDDRYSKVFVSSISQIGYQVNQNIYTVDLEFISPAPYEQYIGRLRSQPAMAGLTTSFNFNYGGNYKTRPVVTIAAAGLTIAAGWSLSNFTTGQSMGYAGIILPGQCLIIDMENQTVLNNGVDDIPNYTGDFLSMLPGQNYLQFAGSTPNLYVDYFQRFV